mgnify:CR=1 FL=1
MTSATYEALPAFDSRRQFFLAVEVAYAAKSKELYDQTEVVRRHLRSLMDLRYRSSDLIGGNRALRMQQLEAEALLGLPDLDETGKKLTEATRAAMVVQAMAESAEVKQVRDDQRALAVTMADHENQLEEARLACRRLERELEHLDAWIAFFARPPSGAPIAVPPSP